MDHMHKCITAQFLWIYVSSVWFRYFIIDSFTAIYIYINYHKCMYTCVYIYISGIHITYLFDIWHMLICSLHSCLYLSSVIIPELSSLSSCICSLCPLSFKNSFITSPCSQWLNIFISFKSLIICGQLVTDIYIIMIPKDASFNKHNIQ